MWTGIEIAAYLSLVLGYALLLVLAIRNRTGRGRAQKLLEAILAFSSLWTVALGLLVWLAPDQWWVFVWHRFAQIGLVLLAVLTADFAEAYVERKGRRTARLAIVSVLFLAAIILDLQPIPLPIVLSPVPSVQLGTTEVATLLLFGAWAVAVGAAWRAGSKAMRRAIGSKHRNRIRYLLVALLSFTVGDLLLFVGGVPDLYVGLAARLLGFSLITFAILRYNLPDLRRFSLIVLRVILMGTLIALLYWLFLLGAGLLVGGLIEVARPAVVIAAIMLAVLIAALVDVAVGPRLHRYFDRTVLGQSYDVQTALRTYSQQVNLILDLERLADTTLEWVRETLRVERAAFVLFTARGGGQIELRVLRATTPPKPAAQDFAADSRFIVHFRNIARPLSQYDLDMLTWFQEMDADERRWLRGLAVDLYVPVLVADKPVALLALGPKADGQPYSREDLETLTILAGQMGTAVENARLVDDLRAVQADLQRLNDELGETNRQLKRLDQAKSDFVAIASHELRTPLSQIFGYSEVMAGLEGDELGDSQVMQQFITGIARGATRLKHVVDAMVDMSLIETGALKMRFAPVPLQGIVQSAVDTVMSNATKRNMVVKIDDLSSLPPVTADAARLEQVFMGLVSNAVKFTPDGGEIVISGHLLSMPSGEAHVEVLVTDQGIGVDPDQQTLIFEKFYRPENALLHSTDEVGFKGAGPGLGLSIAKGFVEGHGGRIWVESPGRNEHTYPGSTFHVRLPVNGPAEE